MVEEKIFLNSQADCELKSDLSYRKINKHRLMDLLWNYARKNCSEGNINDLFYYFAVLAYSCRTDQT